MSRLGKFLQSAQMCWERRDGIYSRRAVARGGAAATDVSKPRTRFPILLCLLLLACLQGYAEGDFPYPTNFVIEGYGGSESFSPKTLAQTSQSFRIFSARFSNSLWLVRFVGPSKELDYVEIGTDGINIFTLKSTESRYQQARSQGTSVQNSASGAVTRGPVPKELAHPHAGILWFALASSGYLHTNGFDFLQPLILAESNSDILLYFGFRQKAEFDPWSKTDPRPRRAVWFHDGIIRDWEKRDFATVAHHREKRWKPPYDTGFTNAVFEATQPTNLGTFSLALRLDYWVFSPKPNAKINTDLALLQHHWLSVTNILLDAAPGSFVPAPPEGATRVGDKRFAVAEGNFLSFNYSQTNGWLSDAEAAGRLADSRIQKGSQLVQRAIAKDVDIQRGRGPRPRLFAVVLFFVPTVIFLSWLFIKRNKLTKGKT